LRSRDKAGATRWLDNASRRRSCSGPLEFGADVVGAFGHQVYRRPGRPWAARCWVQGVHYQQAAAITRNRPSLSPFNAWVLVKGMETLGLRVERHCANAAKVAMRCLAFGIGRTAYPGPQDHPQHALAAKQIRASARRGLRLKGGKEAAFKALIA